MSHPPDMLWTTRRLLQWTADHLKRKGFDHARLRAEMLLAHVLECKRLELYMHADRPASQLERAAFRELVERAVAGEPVEYLVSSCSFFSLTFAVNAHVLIPRPSTETLVEHVLQHARRTPGFASPVIADVGTGSGCIAVTLARQLPTAHVIATDLSPEALVVARDNARRHGVEDRMTFLVGDLLEPLAGQRLHYLVSNPPYIPDREWPDVGASVKDHEPTMALRGGADGLKYVRPIVQGAATLLHNPGQLVVEIASATRKAVLEMAQDQIGLADARILEDHEQLPRVLVADRR